MKARPDSFRLPVRLKPRARRTQLVGWHGSALEIQVNAPPVDGAANDALIAFLAELVGVGRSRVRLLQGASGRNKLVEIDAPAAVCRAALERAGVAWASGSDAPP